jgi:hypothetical protein
MGGWADCSRILVVFTEIYSGITFARDFPKSQMKALVCVAISGRIGAHLEKKIIGRKDCWKHWNW